MADKSEQELRGEEFDALMTRVKPHLDEVRRILDIIEWDRTQYMNEPDETPATATLVVIENARAARDQLDAAMHRLATLAAARGVKVPLIARAAGTNRSTVYRWTRDDAKRDPAP